MQSLEECFIKWTRAVCVRGDNLSFGHLYIDRIRFELFDRVCLRACVNVTDKLPLSKICDKNFAIREKKKTLLLPFRK